MTQDFLFIFSIWLSTLIIGLVSWPSTMLVFHRLSDRGHSIAKILGLFTIGYVLFFLATLKIIPLSLTSLLLVFFIWAGINIFLEFKYKIL